MHSITVGPGASTVNCPVCGAKVEFFRGVGRIAEHKRKDRVIYDCPAARKRFSFKGPMRASAKTKKRQDVAKAKAKSSKSVRAKDSRRGMDKDEQAASRYMRRVGRVATRQSRYMERDFAVWAEGSWGDTNSTDTGGRNSVHAAHGGRVQSNRSRY